MLIEQTLIERAYELADELEAVAEGGMDHAIVMTLRTAATRLKGLEHFVKIVGNHCIRDEMGSPNAGPVMGPETRDCVITRARELAAE